VHNCKGCEHKEVKYCPDCRKVYCMKCGKEWVEEVYQYYQPQPDGWYPTYPYWYPTYPYPTYPIDNGLTIICGSSSNLDDTITCGSG